MFWAGGVRTCVNELGQRLVHPIPDLAVELPGNGFSVHTAQSRQKVWSTPKSCRLLPAYGRKGGAMALL
jgi:hypothetical protein